MVAAMDSDDSSLQVGPPRHAASPQPTRPSAVSRRTKTKLTASRVVKDILWGRATGMSARMTRALAIFMRQYPRSSPGRQAGLWSGVALWYTQASPEVDAALARTQMRIRDRGGDPM